MTLNWTASGTDSHTGSVRATLRYGIARYPDGYRLYQYNGMLGLDDVRRIGGPFATVGKAKAAAHRDHARKAKTMKRTGDAA